VSDFYQRIEANQRRDDMSGLQMTDVSLDMPDANLDELGPIDYVIVEFPAGTSSFIGEMAPALLALVDAGIYA
jgi:hypothetical protein